VNGDARGDAQPFRDLLTAVPAAVRWALAPDDGPAWWHAVFASILALVVVARPAFQPGVPAFQHDWMWPTSQQAVQGWMQLATSAWVWSGTGSAQVYPFAQYLVGLEALFALIAGAKATLIGFMAIVVALAAGGATQTAAACGVRRRIALAGAGATYALSPVVYNKLCAGHTYYLLALALLPWIFVVAWRARVPRAPAIAALAFLCALSWSQAQFIVFDTVLLVALVALRRERATAIVAFSALALAACVHAYSLAMLVHPAAGSQLQHQTSNLAGVATESADLWQLLRQDGYPPGYFRTITHDPASSVDAAWDAALILGILALTGYFAAARVRRFAREPLAHVAIVGAFGALVAAGFHPPFGFAVRFVFAHFPPASILKELYHAMVAVSLAYAVGLALLADVSAGALALRERRIGVVAGCTLAVCAYATVATALPVACGSFVYQVQLADGAPLDALVARETAGRVAPGRVLLLPSIPPLRSFARTNATGGQDSDALRPWQWSAAYSGQPDPALAYAETAVAYGPTAPLAAIAKRLGIAAIVFRKELHSTALESAGMPDPAAFDYPAQRGILAASGLAPVENDAAFEVWPVDAYAGIVLAGPAPLATSSDTAMVDQLVGRRLFPRGEYAPARFVDPFAPGTTTRVNVFALAQQFNAHDGWTPTQFSYFVDRWQNDASEGAIFTLVPAPLSVDLGPRGAGVLFVRLAFGAGGVPTLAVAAGSDGAFRAAKLVPLEPVAPERFTWYAVRLPSRAKRVTLAFGVDPNGLALAQLRAGERTSAFTAVRLPARVPDVHASAAVVTATPSRIVADVRSEGTGTCSATLLTAYDPRWSARAGGAPLAHFVADGWANGYELPCGGTTRVTFAYDGRLFAATALAGRLLLAGFALVALSPWLGARARRLRGPVAPHAPT